MKRTRLLSLLALLMTVATGAWAQGAKHSITATYGEQTRLLEQPLPYETTVGALFEAVTGKPFSSLISTFSALNMPLSGISSNNTSVVSIGELNDASTPVTVKADGEATVSLSFSGYYQGIFVSVVPPLYVTMADGTKDADKWTVKVGDGEAQALPIGGLKGEGSETVTLKYTGRLKVKGVKATSDATPTGKTVDLSTLTADYEAQDGEVLTGTLGANVKISIADGATVKLKDATINGGDDYSYKWAGLNCAGDATITLEGTNMVKGFYNEYPGIYVPSGKTLTIQGTGSLNARSNGYAAGIGGGYKIACGNITISGGTVEATGGDLAAGIGGGNSASCGNITINGGTITATGGKHGPGIGGGKSASCGNITIANTVTKVTATKGAEAPHSIGKGTNGTCGTVTIGGTKYWENNAAVNGGDTYLAQSPLIYDPTAPAAQADPLAVPMTIEAITAGAIKVSSPKAGMQYSLDGGKTKNAVTTDDIVLNVGDKVQFYGNGTSITSYNDTFITSSGDGFTCKVYGNIMSLVDEENFATATTLSENYTFSSLFSEFITLTDASGLLLPATQLTVGCYNSMFYGCTALTTAPALPATQLAPGCYQQMFRGCARLTTAPELPATQLVASCYLQMFQGCASLTTAPGLPARQLAAACYMQMFSNCTALTASPMLPAETLVSNCYTMMFYNCSKLATVTCLATSGINQSSSTTRWLNGAGSQAEGTKTVYTISTANWPEESNNGIPTDWTRVNIDI